MNFKKALSIFAALAFILLSGCGEAIETRPTVSASSDRETIVLAADEARFKSVVEEFNAGSQRVQIEILNCRTATELLSALERGESADMYLVQLDDQFRGDKTEDIWELSVDLKSRFEDTGIELVGELEKAMEYNGELRLLPFDFKLFTFITQLEEMPDSISQAKTIADDSGVTLFPMYRDKDNLTTWLLPFLIDSLAEGDTEQFDEMTNAIEAHEGKMSSEVDDGDYLFDMRFLDNSTTFGLPYYAENCSEFGIPGSKSRAFYSPNYVFGILSSSRNTDEAWDFLKYFYSEDIQQSANALPATETAFNKLIRSRLEDDSSHDAATAVNELAHEANAAAPGMAQSATLHGSEELLALLSQMAS